VQSDLLRGKSIGFLPTKVHVPTSKEVETNNWQNVQLVIDEWILLEYACCYLPCQQNAVVEAVSKSLIPEAFLKAMGLDLASAASQRPVLPTIPFTPLEEVERALRRAIERIDLPRLAQQTAQERLDRVRGRV
jgi:hypothetical protein